MRETKTSSSQSSLNADDEFMMTMIHPVPTTTNSTTTSTITTDDTIKSPVDVRAPSSTTSPGITTSLDDEASLLSDDDDCSAQCASPLGEGKLVLKAFPTTNREEENDDGDDGNHENSILLQQAPPPTTLPALLYSDNEDNDDNDLLPESSLRTRKLSHDSHDERPLPLGSRITSITYVMPPSLPSLFVDLTISPGGGGSTSSSSASSTASAVSSSRLIVNKPPFNAGEEEPATEERSAQNDYSSSNKEEEDNPSSRRNEPQQATILQDDSLRQEQHQPLIRCVYPDHTTTTPVDDDAASGSSGSSSNSSNEEVDHIMHHQQEQNEEPWESPSRYPTLSCDAQQPCWSVKRLSTTSGQTMATSTCSSSSSSSPFSCDIPTPSKRQHLPPSPPDVPVRIELPPAPRQTITTTPSARLSEEQYERKKQLRCIDVTAARKNKCARRRSTHCETTTREDDSDEYNPWNKRRRTRRSRVPQHVRDRPTKVQEVSECVPLAFFDRQVLHELSLESMLWNPPVVVVSNNLTKRTALTNKETKTRTSSSSQTADDEEEDDDELAQVPGCRVCKVEYDPRHWRVDENDDGVLVDQLQRVVAPQGRSPAVVDSPAPPQQWTRLPDPPLLTMSASRRGPAFQARMPYTPSSTACVQQEARMNVRPTNSTDQKIWDPVQANEAIERGEDIDGFLEGELELSTKTKRMEVLHACHYSVQAARLHLANSGVENWTTAFSEAEALEFDGIVARSKKDFGAIAERLGRSKTDVLMHYYKWKGKSAHRYRTAKPRWKQWCAICDEEEGTGERLNCQGCKRYFHLQCVSPFLREVPWNDWYCERCSYKGGLRNDDLISSPLSQQL